MGNQTHKVEQVFDTGERGLICQRILEGLPEWFGQPESIEKYVQDAQVLPMFVVRIGNEMLGIMVLKPTSKSAVDIHVMAVEQARHRQGLGRGLVNAAKEYVRRSGALYLTVKTLGPSCESQPYAQTRRFYRAMGFEPLEELLDYWGKGNPTLIMCQKVT